MKMQTLELPMSAFSSITHRLSGIYVFFVTLPLLLYIISESTSSKSNFDQLLSSLNTFNIFSIFFYISISIFWYHILTGIRHLIMDFFHVGESLQGANYSAIFVICFWMLSFLLFLGYNFIWKAHCYGISKDTPHCLYLHIWFILLSLFTLMI